MKKPSGKIETVIWFAAFAAIVVLGKYVLPQQIGGGGNGKTVRIGYVSWAEGIAMTYLAQAVLEERMGYDVRLTMADPAPIFTSLANGDLDFFLDAWLPVTHRRHMDKYGDVLTDLGYNYRDARIGLVAPQYVDVDTVPELAENTGLFNGDITGIDSGAGIMEATRRAIDEYGLGMDLLTSSGAAMTASLKDAIQSDQPIVVTGWKPHWMFARWDLKFLDDPKKVYGEIENIHTIGRPNVSQDLPELASFFREFMFTDQQIGSLMDAMNRAASQQEAAVEWMNEHKELADSWLKGN
jgi:glycine betaine/proline transport system substrate-binding protein